MEVASHGEAKVSAFTGSFNTNIKLKSVQKIKQKFAYMILAKIFCIHF